MVHIKKNPVAVVQPVAWMITEGAFVRLEAGPTPPDIGGLWQPLYAEIPASKRGAGEYLRSKARGYQNQAGGELRLMRGQPSALTRKLDLMAEIALKWADELDARK